MTGRLPSLLRWLGFFGLFVIVQLNTASAQNARVVEWSRGNSTIGILFLHGLGGCAVPFEKSEETWCANGATDSFRNVVTHATWPGIIVTDDRVLLPSAIAGISPRPLKIEDLGVWGIDYSLATTSPCTNLSIPQLAQVIEGQLDASGFLDRYENIIIVAHSMGGLLTKQILLDWQVQGDPQSRLPQIIGVMLLGVPSQGSPAAPEGVWRYALESLGIYHLANICGRNVKDLIASNENTWLEHLETSWQGLLTTLQAKSHSLLPMTGCAYETVAEKIGMGFTKTIVPMLYENTQCSLGRFPVGSEHTKLPKPADKLSDVHSAWLLPDMRRMLQQWSAQPAVTYAFDSTNSAQADLAALQKWSQQRQTAFSVDLDPEIAAFRPRDIPYKAANHYALVMKIVEQNSELCMQTTFPTDKQAVITLRKRESCKGSQ